ncbi:MAG: SAM-dependent methyltransferase [Flavobacteriales bacterium]
MKKGILYLLPNTLGGHADTYCTAQSRAVTATVRCYLAEELKSARRLLRANGYTDDFSDIQFEMLNEHTREDELMSMLTPLIEGKDMAIISEAGLPCVADPGSNAVLLAQHMGVRVVPLSGPSSILMTLISSGLGAQRFTFNGYVPREKNERMHKLKQLETHASQGHTQLLMDAPYRNNQLMDDLLKLRPSLHLCIAVNISLPDEWIKTKTVAEWKMNKPELHKKPVMFALGS